MTVRYGTNNGMSAALPDDLYRATDAAAAAAAVLLKLGREEGEGVCFKSGWDGIPKFSCFLLSSSSSSFSEFSVSIEFFFFPFLFTSSFFSRDGGLSCFKFESKIERERERERLDYRSLINGREIP